MLLYLLLATSVGGFAADLSVLNEDLRPTGLKLSSDGQLEKGSLRESRLADGRTIFSPPEQNLKGMPAETWSASVSRGKDGQLRQIQALRIERGLPTDEFTATLDHASILAITSCRHPGYKSCVTATASSCGNLKRVFADPKRFEEQKRQCGGTLKMLGDLYDASTIASAHADLGKSTSYATSPLAGLGTAFEAVSNLKEVCDKYSKHLASSTGVSPNLGGSDSAK